MTSPTVDVTTTRRVAASARRMTDLRAGLICRDELVIEWIVRLLSVVDSDIDLTVAGVPNIACWPHDGRHVWLLPEGPGADWSVTTAAASMKIPGLIVTQRRPGPATTRILGLSPGGLIDPATAVRSLAPALRAVASGLNVIAPSYLGHRSRADDECPAVLSVAERSWLNRLAAGESVADLADRSGVSARTMHRRLRALYARLGVESRGRALVAAASAGLLGGGDQGESGQPTERVV